MVGEKASSIIVVFNLAMQKLWNGFAKRAKLIAKSSVSLDSFTSPKLLS